MVTTSTNVTEHPGVYFIHLLHGISPSTISMQHMVKTSFSKKRGDDDALGEASEKKPQESP